jgi:hypothetical protein
MRARIDQLQLLKASEKRMSSSEGMIITKIMPQAIEAMKVLKNEWRGHSELPRV